MSSILHRCLHCGFETEISNSLAAFADNPHCRRCGLSASESDIKMANDLAALFDRQMNVGVATPADIPHTATPPTPDSSSPPPPQSSAPPIVYSVSRHYHHSSHQAVPGVPTTAKPAATTGSREESNNTSPEDFLRRHGIDPYDLFPSQLVLFQQAGWEQRERLVELWRISSSSLAKPASHDHSNVQTTHGNLGFGGMGTGSDSHQAAGIASVREDEMMETDGGNNYDHAEPYVVSGYEALKPESSAVPESTTSYSQSTDPVYKGHDFWRQPTTDRRVRQSMEDQYGAYQMRNMYFGCGIRTPHFLEDEEML